MLRSVLLYTGAAVIACWGIAHIVIPTRKIIEGFGVLSTDNERILLMEWIMEGVTLAFIGVLVATITMLVGAGDPAATIVYRAAASMLVVMAGVSAFTGARTSIIPMKLCPWIFASTGLLFWFATVV